MGSSRRYSSMRKLGVLGAVFLGVMAITPKAGAQDEAAARPTLVVVPGASKGVPPLGKNGKILEAAFEQVAQVQKLGVFGAKVRESGVGTAGMATVEGASQIAKLAGIDYVVIATPAQDGSAGKKKAKAGLVVNVVLVNVAEAAVVQSGKLSFAGKKIAPAAANKLAATMAAKIVLAPAPVPVAPPPPEPVPVVVAPPPEPAVVIPPPEPAAVAPQEVAQRSPGRRPALRISLGGGGYTREALVSASGVSNEPCYCVGSGQSAPIFGAGTLSLEFFPMMLPSLALDDRWFAGFGLFVDGMVALTDTVVDDSSKKTTSSTVISGRGGLAYRLRMWGAEIPADVQFRVGYSYMSFPLTGGAFPGLVVSTPYLGALVSIPMIDTFTLLVGGGYSIFATGSGGADKFGKQSSGSQFYGEAGLRYTVFDLLEFGVMGRIEQNSLKYSGTTSLKTTDQFKNISVTDQWISGTGYIGFIFL